MGTGGDDPAFVHHLDKHDTKLLNNLCFQWQKEDYCDLVILAESNQPLAAHACVLSAFSPKIASLVSKANTQTTWEGRHHLYTVEVTFSLEVMKAIVTALYTGVFQPQTKILKDVLMAVQWLKIAELIVVIEKHLCVDNERDEIADSNESVTFSSLKILPIKSDPDELPEPEVSADNCNGYESSAGGAYRSRPIRKRKYGSSRVGRDIRIKIPRIDKVDHKTLDAIVKLEVDSSCKVNFEKCSQVIEDEDTDCQRERKQSSGGAQLKRVQKRKSLKSSQQGKATPVKTREQGKQRSRKPGSEKQGKKNSASEISVCEGREEGDSLESVIEEVNKDDPVNEELDFLMGNISFLKCKKCGDKFTSMEIYHEHINNHPDYKCSECGMTFYNKAFLTRHIRAVHTRDFLNCRHCGFEAQSQVMLRQHCVSEHGDNKPFTCPVDACSFRSPKYDRVIKHLIIHRDDKEFMCDKCSQSFARQRSLVYHQRACYHLQEFLCDLCGQAFNHIQSMRKHRQTIHFGEKPYKCSVCSTAFSDHRNLSRHMRIHENTFPYSCPLCQQKYRHSNSLKAHMVSKHQDLTEPAQVTQASNKLGGASYKRVLKNDHINAITARVSTDREKRSKKRSSKVKREASSPTQMYQTASFSGEFLMPPPEDSTFDASNGSDLEIGIDSSHALEDLSNISKPDSLNGESSLVLSQASAESRFPLDTGVLEKSSLSNLYHSPPTSTLVLPHSFVDDRPSLDISQPVFRLLPSDKNKHWKNHLSSIAMASSPDARRSPDAAIIIHQPLAHNSQYLLGASLPHKIHQDLRATSPNKNTAQASSNKPWSDELALSQKLCHSLQRQPQSQQQHQSLSYPNGSSHSLSSDAMLLPKPKTSHFLGSSHSLGMAGPYLKLNPSKCVETTTAGSSLRFLNPGSSSADFLKSSSHVLSQPISGGSGVALPLRTAPTVPSPSSMK